MAPVRRKSGSRSRGKRKAADPTSSCAPPTQTDFRRYRAARAGQSPADIAADDRTTVAAVEASLRRVRIDNARFSPEATGIEIRRSLLAHAQQMDQVFTDAFAATRLRTRSVIKPDPMTGELQTLEESEEYADHDTRLKAIDTMRAMLSVVQPRDPAVVVTSNSQTNILNQGAQQQALPGRATSAEMLIRQIRQERGLALTEGSDPTAAAKTVEAIPQEQDAELQEDLEEIDEGDDEGGDDDEDDEEDTDEEFAEDED